MAGISDFSTLLNGGGVPTVNAPAPVNGGNGTNQPNWGAPTDAQNPGIGNNQQIIQLLMQLLRGNSNNSANQGALSTLLGNGGMGQMLGGSATGAASQSPGAYSPGGGGMPGQHPLMGSGGMTAAAMVPILAALSGSGTSPAFGGGKPFIPGLAAPNDAGMNVTDDTNTPSGAALLSALFAANPQNGAPNSGIGPRPVYGNAGAMGNQDMTPSSPGPASVASPTAANPGAILGALLMRARGR